MTNSKKRNIAIVWLLTLVMLVSGFFAVSTFSQTAEAFTGTEIATAEEFVDFITNVASVGGGDNQTYSLTANVDLSAYSEDSVFISNLAGAVNLNGKFHYGTYYLENVPGNPSSIFGEAKSSVTEDGATVAGKENIRIVIKDVTVTTAEALHHSVRLT